MSWHSNELRVIANILEDYEGVNDKSDNLRMAAAGLDRMEDQIARLTAEVERLTPKIYPMTEIVSILNRNKHRKTDSWVIYRLAEEDYFASTPVGFDVFANDDGDLLETWEANLIADAYVAKGLLRDAGPIVVRESVRGEKDANA